MHNNSMAMTTPWAYNIALYCIFKKSVFKKYHLDEARIKRFLLKRFIIVKWSLNLFLHAFYMFLNMLPWVLDQDVLHASLVLEYQAV